MDASSLHARFLAGVLWLAAALPVLLALASHASEPEARAAIAAPTRPGLTFDYHLVDRGPAPPGPYVRGLFRFTNTGDAPVTITRLEPSCGCLQPRLDKAAELRKQDPAHKLDRATYVPGETGTFEVVVRTANEDSGPHEYLVKVHYMDPQPRQTEVAFKAVFPEHQVRVAPPAVVIYDSGQGGAAGEAPAQIVTVSDYRARPMRLTGVEVKPSAQLVQAELGTVDESEPGERRMEVKITVAANLPPERREAVVVLTTDDPTYPEVTIPVFVQRLDRAAFRTGGAAGTQR